MGSLLEPGLPRLTPYGPATIRQLLDTLERSWDDGVTVEHQQYRLGWACIAAPLVDGRGRLVAAIGITGS